jgi:hypothetical protein
MLRCSVEELVQIAATADFRYRVVNKAKKNGATRTCFDATRSLKAIQARIKSSILEKVRYPSYLMGGIADHDNPRDYVRNAKAHVGARVMVNEDIAQFFPSVSGEAVFEIWRHLFHFPLNVAQVLTQLTTRRSSLPQGAKTSSYLANLAFWSTEPAIVAQLRSRGFEYTRYIDDITISSKEDRSPMELLDVFNMLAAMVRRYGLRLRRSKHRLVYSGARMEVTGLVVTGHSAGLGRRKRSALRALVHQCETHAQIDPASPVLGGMKRRAASLAGQYARLHPVQGKRLQRRLRLLPK